MLTEDQVAFYRENGYLMVPNVFSAAELAELNRVTDDYVEASRRVSASDAVFDVGPGHAADAPKLRRIKDPVTQDPAYTAAMKQPRLIAILQQLLGPGIRFDHSKLNIKPVGGGAAIDWHQDWAFYPHTNDDLLAVGVFLGDVGPESGPLQVIPGSHRGPVLDHHDDGLFCGAIQDRDMDAYRDKAVAITGAAGSVSIHHVRTIHGSTPNHGRSARRLLLFSYGAVDAWPLVPAVDLATFDAQIVTGAPTVAPRQEALPVRLPLPRAAEDDSIFDNQSHKRAGIGLG
jgi:phytanoyl-CoA hydroxylase